MIPYSNAVLRAVALRTQGLSAVNEATPTPACDSIHRVLEKLGCVQIDTLHMVARSHYLVLWSRLGDYPPTDFDILLSNTDRRLFEGWMHAACIIPLTDYRYQMPHQRRLREEPARMSGIWLSDPQNAKLVQAVLERIHREGAVRTSDFEGDGHKRNSWWDWKPAKNALEHLYAWGDLMIAGRYNFQRIYDLTERILPGWVDIREPTAEERDRFWVERGAKALGICLPRHTGDYTWMKVSRSRPIVESLVKEGVLVPIQGLLADGKTAELLVHRDNLPLLEQAADGSLKAVRTTFLSPFDNLFWAARRDEQFWGFHQALEAYLPAPKRQYGYFCLPILHKDNLVGRFDPKLERKDGLLRLKALYLEPGVKPDEELVREVATALRDFLAFHKAKDLVIERSQPDEFRTKLLASL